MTPAAAEHHTPAEHTVETTHGYPEFTGDDYKAVFRHHPGGVALITAVGPDGPVALTATSVASVSAEPPLLVFSVSAMSSSLPALKVAETVIVHFLGAD